MQAVIGIDIGGTSTKLGAINREGDILHKTNFSTVAHSNEQSFLHELKDKIDEVLDVVGRSKVACIGAGAPMANYSTGIVKGPANLSWKKEVNLKSFLENTFEIN